MFRNILTYLTYLRDKDCEGSVHGPNECKCLVHAGVLGNSIT